MNQNSKMGVGRPKNTGEPSKQMNVGMPQDLLQKLTESGRITYISFSGYVKNLIKNDLNQNP
jgi:hypothetical protein